MSRAGSVHTNRDFLLLWSGNAVSLIGFHGVRIAYPMLAMSLTDSAAQAGWVMFALTLPALIFQIPAGIVADFADRRRVLIACACAGLAATAIATVVVLTGMSPPGPVLVATAFVEGTAYVFFTLSELGAIRDVVTVEQRPAAFAFFEAEQPIALVVGRAAGAAVFGAARWLPFAANAVTSVFCLITLAAIRGDFATREAAPDRRGAVERVREGVRIVWNDSFLRLSTAVSGAANLVIQVVILLMIVGLTQQEHPAWTVGAVLAAAGVGGVLGSFAAAPLTRRYSAPVVYRGALWAWTGLLIPITVGTDPVVLAAAWGGVGAVGTVVNVALTTFRVDVIPEEALGRAVASVHLVTDGATALGGLLAGFLLGMFGTAVTGWTTVAAMLTLAVLGSRVRQRVPAEPPASPNVGSTLSWSFPGRPRRRACHPLPGRAASADAGRAHRT
ncbi:MFS transporter [Nocardia cyriacigeorgica]|uniref:2-acyl-glycerophospho-ethanolamine acyltransferase n=1 Tax=Nocardia cyriacigeorgica TaxID=135487 RepID=A0A4U8W588_9NOCA|nr:MFS transporter [Nocardia cyriacigeorgica]VFB00386.1 2-acyl-glycerophospho-ethanolamine acyltransferase [Nocardia cyriacigeorgica]